MSRIIRFLALGLTLVAVTGCAELELGATAYKGVVGPSQQGTFKVGKPYSVMGRTYYPQETYSYTETGIASWYGPGFHGKRTASGEKFDQNELTAAHRTLQMPSLVRVTNLDNGRSVVVRVNDRGPFSRGRVIDVSEKAAQLLGMKGTGTAKVKLELMAEESKMLAAAAKQGQSTKGMETTLAMGQPAAVQPATYQTASVPGVYAEPLQQTAAASNIPVHVNPSGIVYPDPVVTQTAVTPTSIYVQAGAFGQYDNAQRLSQKLSAFGQTKIETTQKGGMTLYRVRIGPLDTVPTADTVLRRVLASGHADALITVH